jgi:hypothetical protein
MSMTWQWYVKNELMILALCLIFFGLLWLIADERPYQADSQVDASFHLR